MRDNDSILGIVITLLVAGIILVVGLTFQGGGIDLPQINAGTNTNNPSPIYDYCSKMGLDC